LRNLSSQILHVQEEERRNISRELHDQVGQHLTAISVMLAAMRNNGAAKSEELAGKIAGTQRLLQITMETVHDFARELRPAILDELGLLPALRSSLNGFARRTGLRVRLHGSTSAEKLSSEQKTVLFRIAQESLTNVAKHARASRVEIVLRKVEGGLCMEIADNGKSFRDDPRKSIRRKQRLGLLGMQERVRLVNGRFNIKPDPSKGTTVQVIVPFKSAGRFARPDSRPDRNRPAGTPAIRSGSMASGSSTEENHYGNY
jgi:signal transduction histidine kinase